MDPKAGAIQARLQQQSSLFQKLERDHSEIIEARQRLDSQLSENELVLKEFGLLKPHNTVYKLVGPSLVPQDQAEARGNVEKRLEFIRAEIKRVENQLKESEEKVGKKRGESLRVQSLYKLKSQIMALQQEFEALQPGGPPQKGA